MPKLRAHALVPHLRERFGAFNAETVQIEIFGVLVALEELLRAVTRLPFQR
jgi:hypothetical protein